MPGSGRDKRKRIYKALGQICMGFVISHKRGDAEASRAPSLQKKAIWSPNQALEVQGQSSALGSFDKKTFRLQVLEEGSRGAGTKDRT